MALPIQPHPSTPCAWHACSSPRNLPENRKTAVLTQWARQSFMASTWRFSCVARLAINRNKRCYPELFFSFSMVEICYGIIKVNSTSNRCLACVDLGGDINFTHDDGVTTATGRTSAHRIIRCRKTTVATILRDRFWKTDFGVVFWMVIGHKGCARPGRLAYATRTPSTGPCLWPAAFNRDQTTAFATISVSCCATGTAPTSPATARSTCMYWPTSVARDPKALYRNQIADMVGEDDTFEALKSPDLVIENYGSLTPTLAVASIWDNLIATDSMLFKEPRYHDKSKPALG